MKLDSNKITETAIGVSKEIFSAFPKSGLSNLSRELVRYSKDVSILSKKISAPNWPLRISIFVICGLMLIIPFFAIKLIFYKVELTTSVSDFMQGFDALVNEIVFIGIGIYFLSSIETRIKRKKVLKILHELRSMAHVIDARQLTKNSLMFREGGADLSVAQYLKHCTELLSIISSIAAISVQNFSDHISVDAVNDVESLCNGLSRKIWQKIAILEKL